MAQKHHMSSDLRKEEIHFQEVGLIIKYTNLKPGAIIGDLSVTRHDQPVAMSYEF